MRLLRLSLLINYLSLVKNKKKALTTINIGIFLSLFALSSAIISFQIERKINKLEISLIEYQDLTNLLSKNLVKIETSSALFDINKINEERNWQDIKLLHSTDLGSKILSKNDFYLPSIISLTKSGILQDDLYGEKFIDHMLYIADDKLNLIMKPVFNSFLQSKNEVLEIDYKKYEKKLFQVSKKELLKEITNNKEYSITDYDSEIYKDYRKVNSFLYNLREYRYQLKDYFRGAIQLSTDSSKKEKNKIIELSRKEKKLILTTFFFQFIIFIIIQFFELSSIQETRKRLTK
mgnify:CR=1 FL=1